MLIERIGDRAHTCNNSKEILDSGWPNFLIGYGGLWDNEKSDWTERYWVLEANTGDPFCGASSKILFCPYCGEELK